MFKINLDLQELQGLGQLADRTRAALRDAARDLTSMARAKAIELAAQRLHSRRRMFVDALSVSQVSDSTWYLQLEGKFRFVDDGLHPHDQLKELLRSAKAKTARDGSRYLVIPFKHGASEAVGEAHVQSLEAVRAELKRRKIAWTKVERGPDGQPKLGRLHAFNVAGPPLKDRQGPGQGHGPVGDVRQGLSNRNAAVNQGFGFEASKRRGGATGHLEGVSVYQRKGAGGKVERSVVSFRVASSKQAGSGRWQHPGIKGVQIFETVERWIQDTWTKDIAPSIVERIRAG